MRCFLFEASSILVSSSAHMATTPCIAKHVHLCNAPDRKSSTNVSYLSIATETWEPTYDPDLAYNLSRVITIPSDRTQLKLDDPSAVKRL